MNIIPFVVLLSTEITKFTVHCISKKTIDLKYFFHPGGIPSGHSSFVSSVATLVGYTQGLDSILFLIAVTFALIVMYDAQGVRACVSKHAKVINSLHKKKLKLNERVGHSTMEVIVGAFFGVSLTLIILKLWF